MGLGLRHDWGPQYTANQFAGELAWLGIRSTPAFVGEPECNGVMERWIRTLKEECLYLHDFQTLEEVREAIAAEENLMEPVLDCVRAYATVGEIVELMKDEYGTWREPEIF